MRTFLVKIKKSRVFIIKLMQRLTLMQQDILNLHILNVFMDMNDAINLINENANFTSAGTSQLSIHTPNGVEQVEVENLSKIDDYYKTTDLGRLYNDYTEQLIKIQKISFSNYNFFICYLSQSEGIDVLKFDNEGKFTQENPVNIL